MLLNINMILLIGVISFLVCGLGISLVIKRFHTLDIPNDRSSHSIPTPRGGGIAIVITIIMSMLSLQLFKINEFWHTSSKDYEIWVILGSFTILALVSLYDDFKNLSSVVRIIFHFLAAISAIALLPDNARLLPEAVPMLVERGLFVFLLVWFINLYNFMDGIDGITAVETITIGFGLFAIFLMNFIPITLGAYGLFVAFAALAFLFYNWHPAKIFMGDVGSIPLGFILGWLLIKLAYEGFWAPALILPLYYLVDATTTLFVRILKGKKPWEAHKEHFYQQLLQKGFDHAGVSFFVIKVNLVLLVFAMIACNSEKVIVMSFIYVVYIIRKHLKIGQPEKTYKELKDDMIKNFKEELGEAKNNLNTIIDKKNKDKKDNDN